MAQQSNNQQEVDFYFRWTVRRTNQKMNWEIKFRKDACCLIASAEIYLPVYYQSNNDSRYKKCMKIPFENFPKFIFSVPFSCLTSNSISLMHHVTSNKLNFAASHIWWTYFFCSCLYGLGSSLNWIFFSVVFFFVHGNVRDEGKK